MAVYKTSENWDLTGRRTLGFRSPNLRQRTFGPLDSQRADQLELKHKLVSASLVKTPSEFPGKKNKGKIPEK